MTLVEKILTVLVRGTLGQMHQVLLPRAQEAVLTHPYKLVNHVSKISEFQLSFTK